jgi:homoserine/homoserine lactone efflux protein
LLPQVVPLLSVSVVASTTCLLGYAWLASHARPWLQNPGPARWLNRIAGSVFIAFGLLLIGLRRPQT